MKKILLALLLPLLAFGQTVLKKPYDDLAKGDMVVTNVSTSGLMTNDSFTINGTPVGTGSNVTLTVGSSAFATNSASATNAITVTGAQSNTIVLLVAHAVAQSNVNNSVSAGMGALTTAVVAANTTGATHTAAISALSVTQQVLKAHAVAQTNINSSVASGMSSLTGSVNAAISTGATHTAQIAALTNHASTQSNINASVSSGMGSLTTTVVAANTTGATHTAQIATNDAFREASRVNYATNSGNAATVGGLTAEEIMRVGLRYYFTTNLISYGAVTGRSCSLSAPTNTQIVVYPGPVTNGQYIATYLIKSNDMPEVLLKAVYSFEFNGYHAGTAGQHPRIGADVYIVIASNGVVVQGFENTDGTELPRSTESIPAPFVIQVNVTNDFPRDGYAIVLKTKMIERDSYTGDLYSYFGRNYWSGFITPVLASQFPTRDEVDGIIDASTAVVQNGLDTHTNRTDNPHDTSAAQVGAVATNDARYLAALTNIPSLGAVLTVDNVATNQGSMYNNYGTVRSTVGMLFPSKLTTTKMTWGIGFVGQDGVTNVLSGACGITPFVYGLYRRRFLDGESAHLMYDSGNFVDGIDYLKPSGDGSALTGITAAQVGADPAGTAGVVSASIAARDGASQDPTGWTQEDGASWTFATNTRTLTVTGLSGLWVNGVSNPVSSVTAQIGTNAGLWYIYAPNGTTNFAASQTAWSLFDGQLATVYNDNDGGALTNYVVADETHTAWMQWRTHRRFHMVPGTAAAYASGLTLTMSAVNSWNVSAGVMFDEDIMHSLPLTNACWIAHRRGSFGRMQGPTTSMFATNGAGAAVWDNAGTLQAVSGSGSANYFSMWVYAQDLHTGPSLIAIVGQAVGTLTTIRAEAPPANLANVVPGAEAVLLYQVILRGTAATYTEAKDYRLAKVTSSAALSEVDPVWSAAKSGIEASVATAQATADSANSTGATHTAQLATHSNQLAYAWQGAQIMVAPTNLYEITYTAPAVFSNNQYELLPYSTTNYGASVTGIVTITMKSNVYLASIGGTWNYRNQTGSDPARPVWVAATYASSTSAVLAATCSTNPIDAASSYYAYFSNLTVYTYDRVGMTTYQYTNDAAGVIARVDPLPEGNTDDRRVVNQESLTDAIAAAKPDIAKEAWSYTPTGARQPSTTTLTIDKPMVQSGQMAYLQSGDYFAASYQGGDWYNVTTGSCWRLGPGGRVAIEVCSTNRMLFVQAFSIATNWATLDVATNWVTGTPYAEFCADLGNPQWLACPSAIVTSNSTYWRIQCPATSSQRFYRAVSPGGANAINSYYQHNFLGGVSGIGAADVGAVATNDTRYLASVTNFACTPQTVATWANTAPMSVTALVNRTYSWTFTSTGGVTLVVQGTNCADESWINLNIIQTNATTSWTWPVGMYHWSRGTGGSNAPSISSYGRVEIIHNAQQFQGFHAWTNMSMGVP